MDTVFSVGTKSKFAAAQYLGAVLHILHRKAPMVPLMRIFLC